MRDRLITDPPKLAEILEREFFTTNPKSKSTEQQYRHALRTLALSLGYQPTPRDLREDVLDWLENRLTIMGNGRNYVTGVIIRLRTIWRWLAVREFEGRSWL